MTLRTRFLLIGIPAAFQACSVDADPPIAGRDGAVTTTNSGGTNAGAGGTNNSSPGTSGSGDTIGAAGSGTAGEGTAGSGGNGMQQPDAEAPPACLLPQYTHLSAFGSIYDGWAVGSSSPSLVADIDGGSIASLDATDGSPTNGSVKLTIPFSARSQQLLFAQALPAPVNLTGTTVSARIKLDSGLNTSPENAGKAYLVVKSTSSYFYAPAAPINLDSSAGWTTLTLDADVPGPNIPGGYIPCDIREIDVVIETGDMGSYTSAVVHIDTILVASRTSDAGADAAPDGAH